MTDAVIRGDAAHLPLPDESVDSIVTDPPYGLGFMGQEWDRPGSAARGYKTDEVLAANPYGRARAEYAGASYTRDPLPGLRDFQQWCEQWAAECLRVLKPGGHLLAFGGTRTWHRLACAIEDAGFEIRDSIHWIYGSGFPKSLNVGDGRGTALKPAHEPIVVARKPLAGTVAENVLKHGTGALNIDACRIQHATAADRAESEGKNQHSDFGSGPRSGRVYGTYDRDRDNYDGTAGRWPPNVVIAHSPACQLTGTGTVRSNSHHPAARGPGGVSTDGHAGQDGLTERRPGIEVVEWWECAEGCPVAELDRQSGVLPGRVGMSQHASGTNSVYGTFSRTAQSTGGAGVADVGGASRFFPVFRYEAKADAWERPRLPDGTTHPTVKPVELMRWLIKLITPPGGLVLDPFAGSGATGEACVIDAYRCVLIDRDPAYVQLARTRLARPIALDLFGGAA